VHVHSGSGELIGSGGGAFLFELRCHARLKPTRMGLRAAKNGEAMGGGKTNGAPRFGWQELELGPTLGRDAGDHSCTAVGRYGVYECPVGQNGRTLLTGASQFRAAEVEVYRVVGR
jgi:hypothetical protein